MHQLLNIRKTTGIGQPALAAFLGMTRQGLEKAEKGLSALSTDNLLKLTRLQVCLDSLNFTDNKKQTAPAEKQKCNNREMECRYFAAVLQRKLDKAELALKKTMYLHEALKRLEPADEGERLWIQKTTIDSIKKLDTCRVATCMRIRKRIYLLTAEADYLNRFVNENQSNYESQ